MYESRIQEKEVQLSVAVGELERLKVQSGAPEAEGFLCRISRFMLYLSYAEITIRPVDGITPFP